MSNPFGPPVDFLMLTVLRGGPAQGYAIVQLIEQLSSGKLFLQDGVVYPALHRLEARGLVEGPGLLRTVVEQPSMNPPNAGREVLVAHSRNGQ